MSKIDKKLLFMYAENARSKLKDLARQLKKSPQRLKYTLKVMEEEKLISCPHTIIDYSYFGQILFRVYFKGSYTGAKDKKEIIEKLRSNIYVVSIYELQGEFDLVMEIEAPNPSRFNKELKKIVTEFSSLNKYKVILNVVTHLYPRMYLLEGQSLENISYPSEVIVGGDRVIEQFEERELRLIGGLLKKPQMRMTNLAKYSGINIKTASSLLKGLQKRKVIRGFKYTLDYESICISKFRIFLSLHNLSVEKEAELLEYFKQTGEITKLNKTVGDWDMEIDLESFNKFRIRQITQQMREEFKDLIENFNLMEFYETHHKSYLPRWLFEEKVEKEEKIKV